VEQNFVENVYSSERTWQVEQEPFMQQNELSSFFLFLFYLNMRWKSKFSLFTGIFFLQKFLAKMSLHKALQKGLNGTTAKQTRLRYSSHGSTREDILLQNVTEGSKC
jgi:hypothetical protein